MNYKTHVNGGILIGFYIISEMKNIPTISTSTAVFFSGSIIGSLLPDIDHTNSYIGRRAKPISKAINKLAGHRKLFHAPLLYLLLYSVSIVFFKHALSILFINGLFIGILSHLILDSLTVGGLPWFYPLSKKKVSLAKIKTNSQLESALCSILIFLNIAILLDLLKITSIFTFTKK